MSIDGVALEHFSTTYQETSSYSLHSRTWHAVFHSVMYDNSKQDAATTDAHSELIIELLEKKNLVSVL